MNKLSNHIKFYFLLVVILNIFTVEAGSYILRDSYSDSDRENISKYLQLHISTAKQTYTLGEPVELELKLTNNSKDKAINVFRFSPVHGTLHIRIKMDKSKFKYYSGPSYGLMPRRRNDLIMPESELIRKDLVYYDHSGKGYLAFGSIDTFYVKAEYYIFREKSLIESNVIELVITEPKPSDKELLRQFNNRDDLYFLHTGTFLGLEKHNDINYYSDLLKKYPNSVYADHIRDGIKKHERFLNPPKPKSVPKPDNSWFYEKMRRDGFDEESIELMKLRAEGYDIRPNQDFRPKGITKTDKGQEQLSVEYMPKSLIDGIKEKPKKEAKQTPIKTEPIQPKEKTPQHNMVWVILAVIILLVFLVVYLFELKQKK